MENNFIIARLVAVEAQKLVGKAMCVLSNHYPAWVEDLKSGNFYRIVGARVVRIESMQLQIRLKFHDGTYTDLTGTPIFSTETGFSIQIQSCYIIEPTELVKLKLGAI